MGVLVILSPVSPADDQPNPRSRAPTDLLLITDAQRSLGEARRIIQVSHIELSVKYKITKVWEFVM